MKIKLLFFSIICSLSLVAQNQIDSNGEKQGPWKKTHPKSTAIMYEGQFKDDKPVGTFFYYYPSKSKQAIIVHDAKSNRSTAIFYHENGNVLSKGIYRSMKKDSVWLNFAPSGRLSSSETFKGDVLDGKKVIYYLSEDASDRTQRILSISNYVDGKLSGEYVEYFDSGIVKTKGTYDKNVKVGIWETNHPNGNLMNLERYKNGELHGWCIVKDESGNETGKSYFYYGERLEGKKLELKMKQFKELGINPNG